MPFLAMKNDEDILRADNDTNGQQMFRISFTSAKCAAQNSQR